MKKIVFAALIAVFIASIGLAYAAEAENVSGKVASVTPANSASGAKAMITIVDNKGEKTAFEVTPTTTLYNANMKPITLDAIKKDAAVKVKGTTKKEGTGVATSIRLEK